MLLVVSRHMPIKLAEETYQTVFGKENGTQILTHMHKYVLPHFTYSSYKIKR